MRKDVLAGLAILLAAGCSSRPAVPENAASGNGADAGAVAGAPPPAATANQAAAAAPASAPAPKAAPTAFPPVEPPAPGSPGGLPDDRTPIAEAPFAAASAQGAANVVQTYHALIGRKKYAEARRLWAAGGEASGMSAADFAASFDKYAQYDAQVGAPGPIEGAAGSLYVEVPVVIYGRLKSGEEVHMKGPVTLRRVNDVPGSTAEQRQWHISASGIRPRLGSPRRRAG